MAISKLDICGLRGFAENQVLELAIPDGNRGSGLTILVGPNNGGKSTIIEAFRHLSQDKEQSFTVGKRNQKGGDRVCIKISGSDDEYWALSTIESGGSEAELNKNGNPVPPNSIFVLPSRRFFAPYFKGTKHNRETYISTVGVPTVRSNALNEFSNRLFQIQKNRHAFDEVLKRVISPVPTWTIDRSDEGRFFLKYDLGGSYHNSDGLGEGIISLLFIIDALYDSGPDNVIVIDEPELSLHPSLQRRLFDLLVDYSSDRQIIIATHSPYFVDLHAIVGGAKISRVYTKENDSTISALSTNTANKINGFLSDLNNPHVLGLDAREVFFLNDNVILVEGQDDVIFYHKILDQLNIATSGQFFGWGVGGAHKMEAISSILYDLGFKRVVGILDGDKLQVKEDLEQKFSHYTFHCIPARDVRTKPARSASAEVDGLTESNGTLKVEFKDHLNKMFDEINGYFASA